MSLWWLLALALGALAAAVAQLGATRLRRERHELRDASGAIRALTVAVTAGRPGGAKRAAPEPGPALPPGPIPAPGPTPALQPENGR